VVVKRSFFLLFTMMSILFVSSIACSQSGRILTSAEATQTAQPTAVPTVEPREGLQPGDMVYLQNKSFLVSMMSEPGGNKMVAAQERGAQVEIIQVTSVEGVLWYFIKAPTGEGWVPEANITTEAP